MPVKPSLSGFDITMWLQHLVLVQRGHEATVIAGALHVLADGVHGFVAVVLYFN